MSGVHDLRVQIREVLALAEQVITDGTGFRVSFDDSKDGTSVCVTYTGSDRALHDGVELDGATPEAALDKLIGWFEDAKEGRDVA